MSRITAQWAACATSRFATLQDIADGIESRRIACPECGSHAVDDNRKHSLQTLSFCCSECGEHFDAIDLVHDDEGGN